MSKKTTEKRYWDDMTVVEAKNQLRIFVTSEDCDGAVQKDWGHCVFARACERQFGSRRVAFFRTVAYVELPQPGGNHVVERFSINKETSKQIEAFDKHGILPEGGFILDVPPLSFKLDEKKRAAKKRAEKKQKAVIHGTFEGDNNQNTKKSSLMKGPQRHPDMVLNWRSGTGKVQFVNNGKINSAE